MTRSIVFDPFLPDIALIVLAVLAALIILFALMRGLGGWWLRGLSLVVLLVALANPSVEREDRAPLSDIVLAVVDASASQRIADRADQTSAALDRLTAEVAAMPDTDLRVIRVGDAPDNGGTRLMEALAQAMAEEPRARIAGAFVISDGQVHDMAAAPDMPAPMHLLQTGHPQDWDRRLIVKNAPAFGIIGEEVRLTLRIEDQGAVPADAGATAAVTLTLGADTSLTVQVPINQNLELPLKLSHGGMNVVQIAVAPAEGELTDRNNAQIVQINGVRDRLRVLLVSGEPHAGERVWRNLLKSDPSVDLVHFTILRPPEKLDGTPVEEMSLIAFPTRELFMEKIDDFDLIIFDRYRLRGILPGLYLENVRDYVRRGGTVLVAAGPEFAGVESLARSPLGEIMPVTATGRVLEEPYRATLTETGRRHPVTEGLDDGPVEGGWGSFLRQVELLPTEGEVLMNGIGGRPLLVLDRVGEGRIAVLGTDQLWLWGRGYEGGGPQLELTRRLAHWMLKEPELEEEALTGQADGSHVTLERRTVSETPPGDALVTGPDGSEATVPLTEVQPGRYRAEFEATELGLYRVAQGDLASVFAVGPSAPREFETTIASGQPMSGAIDASGGGVLRLAADADFDVRRIGEGRTAEGRGWLGITPRGAFSTQGVTVAPLLPGWLWLVLAAGLIVLAWLREGRFRRPHGPELPRGNGT
ncbi:membrane protein [Falsirhodobacter sp. alg1]|uniref:membrane protein n=1 Tax=Falsirhodobacter sp. alg1 TaxID=1472418 RepID=UPI0005F0590C|nr:membrane protein [Falsirhodobacter sp. alg1]